MKVFVTGVIIGIFLFALGIVFYFVTGRASASVEDKPLPFERTLAHAALDARIKKDMPTSVPIKRLPGLLGSMAISKVGKLLERLQLVPPLVLLNRPLPVAA